MSESEFDAYLSLLGKLLNLSARQRMQIADELRDHLEERFQSLLDQGLSRDEALRLAVEDLGDAAALAQQFALPHHIRRRRQLMRYSLGSAVVIATTFIMAAFFWPAHRQEPGVLLQAQPPGRSTATAVDASPSLRSATAVRDELMAKLETRGFELNLDQTPFLDALSFLSDICGVDLLLDQRHSQDVGLDASTPVTLKVREGALSVRSALDLILEQVGGADLACAVRDGVILISSADNAYENRVYNCRDLLDGVEVHQPSGGGFGGGGFGGGTGGGQFQVRPETLAAALVTQLGGGGLGGGGMGGSGYPPPATTSAAGLTLIQVIQAATAPASWVSLEGQGGTISEYDGLLIIRHQPRVHQKIEELLTQLRSVRGEHPAPRAGAAGIPVFPGTSAPTATDGFSPHPPYAPTVPGALPQPLTPQPGAAPGAGSAPRRAPGAAAPRTFENQPQSELAPPFRAPNTGTLTIGAMLELGDADPKSVQSGKAVWLDNTTIRLADGTDRVAAGTAKLVQVTGPGPRAGTLDVLIEGPVGLLAEMQRKNADNPVRVWLKELPSRPATQGF